MALTELNFKAHTLMGAGTVIGTVVAETLNIRYPLTMGLLTGLLFSIHIYRKCILVLIVEYKRLKAQKNSENENIS